MCLRKKEHQNSAALGKDTINNWIILFLSVEKRFSFNKGKQPDVYLMKNCTKIGLRLNKQMVGLKDIKV